MDEVTKLAKDLDRAARRAPGQAKKVVAKGANNVKRDARKFSSGLAHAPHYPRSIGYDLEQDGPVTTATVGPDKDLPQGALGNILEYGTVKNAPFAHLGPALDIEGPKFEQAMADMADGLFS